MSGQDQAVTITRPDGSKETQPPYTTAQLRRVQKGERPAPPRKAQRKLTAEEKYPSLDLHRTEWDDVLQLARPILEAEKKADASGSVSVDDLEPFAVDGCLAAYLQWRNRNTGPAIVTTERPDRLAGGWVEGVKLTPRLGAWIRTEVRGDVLDGVDDVQRGTRSRKHSIHIVLGKEQGDVEKMAEASDPGYSWIDRWADLQETVAACQTVPDPLDRLLIDIAVLAVHRPQELLGLGWPEFPVSFADNRDALRPFLADLFGHPGRIHICPREIEPRLKRAHAWLNAYKAAQGDPSKIPVRGRRWMGLPRGLQEQPCDCFPDPLVEELRRAVEGVGPYVEPYCLGCFDRLPVRREGFCSDPCREETEAQERAAGEFSRLWDDLDEANSQPTRHAA